MTLKKHFYTWCAGLIVHALLTGEIGMDRLKREGVKRLLFVKSPT
jgi:hypothetical protein